jgi:hypothetical protein
MDRDLSVILHYSFPASGAKATHNKLDTDFARLLREAVIDHVVGEDAAVGILRRLRRIQTQHVAIRKRARAVFLLSLTSRAD